MCAAAPDLHGLGPWGRARRRVGGPESSVGLCVECRRRADWWTRDRATGLLRIWGDLLVMGREVALNKGFGKNLSESQFFIDKTETANNPIMYIKHFEQ